MHPFLETLSKNNDLKLNGLDLGWGSAGWSLASGITLKVASLSSLLESLGWEAPKGSKAKGKTFQVVLDLSYERSQYPTGDKRYVIVARLVVQGPLAITDLFPSELLQKTLDQLALPALDQVELRFELEEGKKEDKNVVIGFQMTFTKEAKRYLLKGLYQKQTQKEETLRILGGSIYASGDGLVSFSFGKKSPLKLEVNAPFFLNTQVTRKDRKDQNTLMGAAINLNTRPNEGEEAAYNQFMTDDMRQSLLGMRLVYSSHPLEGPHLQLINQILPVFHVQPLDPLLCATYLEDTFGEE